MGSQPCAFIKQNSLIILSFLLILFLCSRPQEPRQHSQKSSMNSTNNSPLETLVLDGYFKFNNIEYVAKDFGNRFSYLPSAVLYPNSVLDIASTIKYISRSNVTVAARGNGHSLLAQSQAHQGIVINMRSLISPEMRIHSGEEESYVDVSGGELWINVLHETLKFGLAPKSWTDYLHLTVGGTLSNAGVSGQTFRHGPQIHNVYQLQVVTGNGDVVTCSKEQNSDLFYGVLGGLGQFGVITRARISLERAPNMVRWIRVLYSDFSKFSDDQEHLISSRDAFDYIEGFVNINRSDLLQSWRSSFTAKDPVQASQIISDGITLYCLEIAKYFNPEEYDIMNKKTEDLLSELSYIPSTVFQSEVSYVDFLERVHASEKKLREKGLWEVPHPWLNLLVPKAKIHQFAKEVFGNILTDNSNGPILIYPVNKSKWNNRTSLVTPEGDVIYLIAFLSSAMPSSTGKNGLQHILNQNQRILDFCADANIGIKQYLPHYTTQEKWRAHFGVKWEVFVQRKSTYDPLAILAPGQRIFSRRQPSYDCSSLSDPKCAMLT